MSAPTGATNPKKSSGNRIFGIEWDNNALLRYYQVIDSIGAEMRNNQENSAEKLTLAARELVEIHQANYQAWRLKRYHAHVTAGQYIFPQPLKSNLNKKNNIIPK